MLAVSECLLVLNINCLFLLEIALLANTTLCLILYFYIFVFIICPYYWSDTFIVLFFVLFCSLYYWSDTFIVLLFFFVVPITGQLCLFFLWLYCCFLF